MIFFWRVCIKTAIQIAYNYGYLKGYVVGALGIGGLTTVREVEQAEKVYEGYNQRLEDMMKEKKKKAYWIVTCSRCNDEEIELRWFGLFKKQKIALKAIYDCADFNKGYKCDAKIHRIER